MATHTHWLQAKQVEFFADAVSDYKSDFILFHELMYSESTSATTPQESSPHNHILHSYIS